MDKPKYEPVFLQEVFKKQKFLERIFSDKTELTVKQKGGQESGGWRAVKINYSSEAWGGERTVELEKGGARETVPFDELMSLNSNLI